MRRADRRDSSDDNNLKNPQARRHESASEKQLKLLLQTTRIQRDEYRADWKSIQKIQEETESQLVSVQQECQQIRYLYQEEQARSSDLLVKYEQVNAERIRYIGLYDESQRQLKYERRSKAGIRGWETRRKNENERLKQEIAEMIILLRESLAKKEEAVSKLYGLAERMDKIQPLIESTEEDANTPKLRRIWVILKEIIGE